MKKIVFIILITFVISTLIGCQQQKIETVALWPFDEQRGIYPSCVISDISKNDYPLVLGPGGQIVEGKFGNALATSEQPLVDYPGQESVKFGLQAIPIPDGRTIEPMTWMNANFCALMTSGENHLRKEVGFVQPTRTRLNLGDFDWTVEFWYLPTRESDEEGVVFEIGQGPRGENDNITRLVLDGTQSSFIWINTAASLRLIVQSDETLLSPDNHEWCHIAFVYDHENKQLTHFVNGRQMQLLEQTSFKSLAVGDEDYMSVGRDGRWGHPLPGRIDELRFSTGIRYKSGFEVPAAFSYAGKKDTLTNTSVTGRPLLFGSKEKVIDLEDRKHLFIDDALLDQMAHIQFVVNPPRLAERVIADIRGPFRKHLNVVEDENGLIRMYNAVDDDYLAVRTSNDGVNWEIPDLPSGHYKSNSNVVLHEPTGMGMVFIDPNAPADQRWKYLSDYHRRGIFVYSSADGWHFERKPIPILPFRSGSQSNIYYDEQRQVYVSFHRSDFGATLSGDTERRFVMTETRDIIKPWPFRPVYQQESLKQAKSERVHDLHPWYLDNGPLTPGGFGFEYPYIFFPDANLDPRETDVYVPKVLKYPWAEDTYLAFPVMYFHYEESAPLPRVILMDPDRNRGSGPIETQLAASRDGLNWKRYPRPAYIGNGLHQNWPVNQAYIAHGMIRRGDEIWQYYYGTEIYHSTWSKDHSKTGVYRVVQRLDGFVSADAPYEQEGYLITKPLTFKGNRLLLNIDTDATGYAQVGFLDEDGHPVEGFSVDDCVYMNGDFIETEVEWFSNWRQFGSVEGKKIEEIVAAKDKFQFTKDVTELQGKIVRVVFKMRGSKLYAMQFAQK